MLSSKSREGDKTGLVPIIGPAAAGGMQAAMEALKLSSSYAAADVPTVTNLTIRSWYKSS